MATNFCIFGRKLLLMAVNYRSWPQNIALGLKLLLLDANFCTWPQTIVLGRKFCVPSHKPLHIWPQIFVYLATNFCVPLFSFNFNRWITWQILRDDLTTQNTWIHGSGRTQYRGTSVLYTELWKLHFKYNSRTVLFIIVLVFVKNRM